MPQERTVEMTDQLGFDPGAGHDVDPAEDLDPQHPEGDKPEDKDKDKGRGEDAQTTKELRRALRESRLALSQANETARFWMDRGQRPPAEPKPKEKPEPKTSVDLLEAVTNGDAKAISQAMRELGFVSADEVEERVSKARQEVVGATTRDQQLYRDFPDLHDEQSSLFRLTSKIYNRLERQDPNLGKSPALAQIAAEMAAKELGIEPEGRRGSRRDRDRDRDEERRRPSARRQDREREYDAEDIDDDEDRDEDREDGLEEEYRERERVDRVRRQAGARGRGTERDRGRRETDADELDTTQKTIVSKLKAAGGDISEDGYRKRAQAGIRMSGLPTRRLPRR